MSVGNQRDCRSLHKRKKMYPIIFGLYLNPNRVVRVLFTELIGCHLQLCEVNEVVKNSWW